MRRRLSFLAVAAAALATRCAFADTLHPTFPGGVIPPPPWPPSWRMNDSTAVFFAGNDTGFNSAVEVLAEARFALVGLGWQLAMQQEGFRHLEALEAQAAAAIKAVSPATRVLVSRENEVALADWDLQRAVMQAPFVLESWWLRRKDGNVANETWFAPGGPLPDGKLWYNFSTPAMAQWWQETWIAAPLVNDNIDGVYWDCSCGAPKGVANFSREAADGQRVFEEAVNKTLASNKAFLTWFSTHEDPTHSARDPADCAPYMRSAIAYGADLSRGVMLFGLKDEALDGDAFVTPLAAFLVARGVYAYLAYPTHVYDIVSEFPWRHELELDYGEPLTLATEVAAGVFVRPYSGANVTLNCSSLSGSITLF